MDEFTELAAGCFVFVILVIAALMAGECILWVPRALH